jgi:hypothetical protein
VLVAAFDGDRVVGAATAADAAPEGGVSRVRGAGLDVARLFYFGESVLLPNTGATARPAFFDHREAQARRCGADAACFAAVIRPATIRRGRRASRSMRSGPSAATRRSGLVTELGWKEHGEDGESVKPMQYWLRQW